MKLRIRGDSIRLRLTRGEVESLAETGSLEETCALADAAVFRYGLRAAQHAEIRASFDSQGLQVGVPRRALTGWAGGDAVSLTGEQDCGAGRVLRILIEKDFACLAPREGEDDSDAFPNPLAESGETC